MEELLSRWPEGAKAMNCDVSMAQVDRFCFNTNTMNKCTINISINMPTAQSANAIHNNLSGNVMKKEKGKAKCSRG